MLTSLGAANFNGTLNISSLGGIVSGGTTELISYQSRSGAFSSSTTLPAGDFLIYGSQVLYILNRVPGPSTWQAATWLGDWNSAGNWSDGVPNGAGAYAIFSNTTGAAEEASTNVPITLGRLDISGSNSTTITAVQGVGLTMQNSGGSTAAINVSGSNATDFINLALTFASNTNVVVASGSTLEIGNPVTVNGGLSVSLSGDVQFDNPLYIDSGGTLQQFGAVVVRSTSSRTARVR